MKHPPAGTASGAEHDFRVFVQGIAPSLHRTAYLLCGDWYLADDLVQETLARAYSHWRKVQRADSPSAYVRRILINESRRNWRRNRKVTVHPDVGVADLAAGDLSEEVVNRDALLQALQSLPARQRATVVLRFLEGVVRLLGQMPEVKVTEGTLRDQPVITLAAGTLITGGGTDSLTINADTGLPITYVSDSVGVTVTYTVSRVTLADVAEGRF
ncbi:SigE family RNA polymerase sigma factor [Micromonospora sp. AMSO31t]|uniref:SigE family RNA polymerase sigma factor n=1 Tax=Micromonospora sp. AMSO31t TaxID=2650566 RepID=UPI001CEDFA14|nr:SigE family RNA polymerase sigma factor [Micromonospora sp. AMSO31t]